MQEKKKRKGRKKKTAVSDQPCLPGRGGFGAKFAQTGQELFVGERHGRERDNGRRGDVDGDGGRGNVVLFRLTRRVYTTLLCSYIMYVLTFIRVEILFPL